MKVISVTLGHARPSFTADVYGAVLPELEQAAAEATAAVVPRRFGLTLDSPSATSAPAQVVDLSKSAVHERRLGDLIPDGREPKPH
jgi:hypothetical protein